MKPAGPLFAQMATPEVSGWRIVAQSGTLPRGDLWDVYAYHVASGTRVPAGYNRHLYGEACLAEGLRLYRLIYGPLWDDLELESFARAMPRAL